MVARGEVCGCMFSSGMVHISKVVQGSALQHLRKDKEQRKEAREKREMMKRLKVQHYDVDLAKDIFHYLESRYECQSRR